MELKTHQKEALGIIKKIWKNDIEIGKLYYSPSLDEDKKKTLGNIYPGEFVSSYAYLHFKTVDLLEKTELIVFKNNPFTVESLKDGCSFEVTDKCKKTSYEDLERLVIGFSEISEDVIIGEFNGVELKTSGKILYKKLSRVEIKQNSYQYLLFKALLLSDDQEYVMPIPEIIKKLSLSKDESQFLYVDNTARNFNKILKKNKLPIKIRKSGEGYILLKCKRPVE